MNIKKISTYDGIIEQEFLNLYREANAYPRTGQVHEVTGDETITNGHSGLIYLSPAAPTVVALPVAVRRGITFKFKRKGNETTAVSIEPAGLDTIDFVAAPYVVPTNAGEVFTIESDGEGNWVKI